MSNTSPAAKKYKRLAVAALASALTFLVVAFLQIPFPIGQGGYINIGDAFIFLVRHAAAVPLRNRGRGRRPRAGRRGERLCDLRALYAAHQGGDGGLLRQPQAGLRRTQPIRRGRGGR